MVGPGQNKPTAPGDLEVVHGLPVGQRLTGMVGRRLQVDERLVHQLRHGHEVGFRKVVGEVLAVRKGPDAEGVTVGCKDWDSLAYVFRGRAVHYGTELRLELPRPLACSDYEGSASQPGHSRLHGGEGAQRGIEEQQSQDLAGERLRLRAPFEPARELQQSADLIALEIGKIQEALHAGRSASVSRSMSTCSSCRMNGGNSRRMLGSVAVPARMPHSNSSAWISLAGRVVRSPVRKPAP